MNDRSVATDGSRHRRLWLAVRWLVAYGITVLMLAAALWAVSFQARINLLEVLAYLACAVVGAAWILGLLVARILKHAKLRSWGIIL